MEGIRSLKVSFTCPGRCMKHYGKASQSSIMLLQLPNAARKWEESNDLKLFAAVQMFEDRGYNFKLKQQTRILSPQFMRCMKHFVHCTCETMKSEWIRRPTDQELYELENSYRNFGSKRFVGTVVCADWKLDNFKYEWQGTVSGKEVILHVEWRSYVTIC